MCRGGLPVTVQQVATGTVRAIEADASGAFTQLRIDRTLQTRVEGELTTSWRSVGLIGSGTRWQQLVVNAALGSLEQLTSESTLQLDVHDSARPDQGQQALTQRVTMTARQVP